MNLSKYNIFSKINDSENFFICNLLSGNADILDKSKAGEFITGIFTDQNELTEKGYLVDQKEEKILFNKKYLEFIDNREKDEIQIFFVPWYSCNFSCPYCYQDTYENIVDLPKQELINSFFEYISVEFKNRRKYVTIFGGEPLLNGPRHKNIIQSIIKESNKRNIDLAIVTNGYYLTEYINILKEGKIREIQVTLDGTKDIHDKRRILKNGDPTFDNIVKGIDSALDKGFNINLRVVIDKENIDNLPELAQFAINRNWTKNKFFKTQLGRNYELHVCQPNSKMLFTRVELYQSIYKLLLENPNIIEFHKPAFSISRFLFENGELPFPLFDSCPGCKTEWAFDYSGKIYSCTATVGKKGEELGTFFPSITRNIEIIEKWQERDVLSIDECKDCTNQLACGGGCASVAKNLSGELLSPDCRPVKELLELGISYYFEKLQV